MYTGGFPPESRRTVIFAFVVKMEAVHSSEWLVIMCNTAPRDIAEDRSLNEIAKTGLVRMILATRMSIGHVGDTDFMEGSGCQ